MSRTARRKCRRCRTELSSTDRYCSVCGTLQVSPAHWSWRGALPPRPPGWFPDPTARFAYRYWDGQTWSDEVTSRGDRFGTGTERDPMRVGPDAASSQGAAGTLQRAPVGLIFSGFFVALGLSGFVSVVWGVLGRPGGTVVLFVASEVGLWIGLLSTCWLISTRYGSGQLRKDFNLRFRWFDVGIGLVGAVLGRVVAGLIAWPFTAPNTSTTTNTDQVFGIATQGALNWTLLTVLICLGAPFFEELFFRGLLQGELGRRFGLWIALPLTAIIFGSAHVFNAPGFAGVVYALSIMGGGLVLGAVYALFRRLGASMATHAFFNAIALTALAISISH